MGSKPAPLLVLARYGRLQKSQEQKTKTKKKNQLHRFLYKTKFTSLRAANIPRPFRRWNMRRAC
jgi:hypothetical protein